MFSGGDQMKWMRAVGQLFTWIGVAGGAVTLCSTVGEMVELREWARTLIETWKLYQAVAWEVVARLLHFGGTAPSAPVFPHPLAQSLLTMDIFLASMAVGTRVKLLFRGGLGRAESKIRHFDAAMMVQALYFWAPATVIVLVFAIAGGFAMIHGSGNSAWSFQQPFGEHNTWFVVAFFLTSTVPYLLMELSGSDIEFGMRLWRVVIATLAFLIANELSRLGADPILKGLMQATAFELSLWIGFALAATYNECLDRAARLWPHVAISRLPGVARSRLIACVIAFAGVPIAGFLGTAHGWVYPIAALLMFFAPRPAPRRQRIGCFPASYPTGGRVLAALGAAFGMACLAVAFAWFLYEAGGWTIVGGCVLWFAITCNVSIPEHSLLKAVDHEDLPADGAA